MPGGPADGSRRMPQLTMSKSRRGAIRPRKFSKFSLTSSAELDPVRVEIEVAAAGILGLLARLRLLDRLDLGGRAFAPIFLILILLLGDNWRPSKPGGGGKLVHHSPSPVSQTGLSPPESSAGIGSSRPASIACIQLSQSRATLRTVKLSATGSALPSR